MSQLGDFIRQIEWKVNNQVDTTKNLALQRLGYELEKGGSL